MSRNSILAATVAATGIAFAIAVAHAQQPDFSQCNGLKGQAAGLCKGGVAVGCDVDNSQPGCAEIETQLEAVTGDPAPWACSCNFLAEVPMTGTNWDAAGGIVLQGACTADSSIGLALRNVEFLSFPTNLGVGATKVIGDPGGCGWEAADPPGIGGFDLLDLAERDACIRLTIAYARDLDALAGFTVTDQAGCLSP